MVETPTVTQLLSALHACEVTIWAEGGELRTRAPKGALTDELRSSLRQLRSEVLHFLQQAAALPRMTIQPVDREGALPASYAQQRLWFLAQLEESARAYHIPLALTLHGALDVAALAQSWQAVVARHEVLRTCYTWTEEGVFQTIQPTPTVGLTVETLAEAGAVTIAAWLVAAASQPFALAQGWPWRVKLLRVGVDHHVLLLTVHHIAADGWSLKLLYDELCQHYHALQTTGRLALLPPLPVQYADYAAWQRDWLQGEVLARQVSYWQSQLAGAPALLELPTDYPRPAVQSYQGATHASVIGREVAAGVQGLSAQAGVTLFMSLLAAFKVLLARYSGQDDIVVGTPIANRTLLEVEPLIGMFVNTLVVRTPVAGSSSFTALLAQVSASLQEAYAHQDLPFERLVEVLYPERSLSHAPLFQVMFVLQNNPQSEQSLPGLTVTPLTVPHETTKFDLTLSVQESAEGLLTWWEYNTDLFAPATIERLAGHYQTLLAGIVAHPDQPICDLPLLTSTEREQLLVTWNATSADYPQTMGIHDLFAAQVLRTPDAPAVVMTTDRGVLTLTYAELNARANQVAHHLHRLGVAPGALVGICVERSLELAVGLLGILKAGGAYVPLDPTYPPDRLAFMLADSAAPVVLTQSHLRSHLPATAAQVICLDDDTISGAVHNPVTSVGPDQLVYVIYTSGSTGRPKGAGVYHHSFVNLVWWYARTFDLTAHDRLLINSSFSFDLTQKNFFAPLVMGGQLHLSATSLYDYEQISQLIAQQQITWLNCAPSAFYALLDASAQPNGATAYQSLASLRYLFLGGEPIDRHRLAHWVNLAQCHATVVNTYGPTECTDVVAAEALMTMDSPIPIGRPIANAQLYILDQQQQLVPVGVAGELHIGGVCVGAGYWQQPALTQSKFIASPFGEGRLYKTGDLCRYWPDGRIEYLGRIDHQVKLRGFRIELGEIEASLRQHPLIHDAVVIARTERGGARLVAYVVPQSHGEAAGTDLLSSCEPAALRAYLQTKVPDYMVPSAFVVLAALPLSPNGKVDRKALPAPDQAAAGQQIAAEPPHAGVEQHLADIWCKVLRLTTVSRNDNFFELGGDSIVSLQVISQARTLGIYLKPRQIFEAQTIARLAEVAEVTAAALPTSAPEVALVHGDVPLLPIQQWFFAHHTVNVHHYNQSVLLEVDRPIDTALLMEAFAYLLQQHDALRLRFTPPSTTAADPARPQPTATWRQSYVAVPGPISSHGDVWRQMITDCYEEVDLRLRPPAEEQQLLQATNRRLQSTLNISTGPLWRVARIRLAGDQPDRLLLVIHHLIVDFVSWRLLVLDLWLIYDQLAQGQTVTLPAKGTSLQAWAHWLANYAQSETVLAELAYWQRLAKAEIQPLPVDYPAPAAEATMATAGVVACALSPAETQALLHEVPTVYHTQINDLLLTALVQCFAAWTGQRTLLLELEGHGREDLHDMLELANTVGWLTALFPLCLALPLPGEEDPSGEAIKAIKEQYRQLPRHGIGYGLLRYLNPTTAGQFAALPQAEVSFNYGGQFSSAVRMTSLGDEWDPSTQLGYRFNINGGINNDQLAFTWLYSQRCYRPETVERLAQGFMAALRALIAHCQSPAAGGYTASDFGLAQLDAQSFARLAKRIGSFSQ